MNNDSLNKASEIVLKAIDKADIETVDKIELLLNLKHFLEPTKYKENIKVLQIEQDKNKWRYKNERDN